MAARTPKGNRPARSGSSSDQSSAASTASVGPATASMGPTGGVRAADAETTGDDDLMAAAELAGDIGAAERCAGPES